MRTKTFLALAVVFLVMGCSSAFGQGYWPQSNAYGYGWQNQQSYGRSQTYSTRYGSGYLHHTYGRPSTHSTPFGNGWLHHTPGRPTTQSTPFGNGWLHR